jgi:hypothetical protein
VRSTPSIIQHPAISIAAAYGTFGLSTKGELDLDAGMPKHRNQSINAETFDLPSD